MRVAIFSETYYPFISGVVTHIETLRIGLEAAGHEVLIVTMNPNAKKHYVKDCVLYCPAKPMNKIYGYGISNPLNQERLEIIRQFNPDILHTHTEFSIGIFSLFCARMLKKPLVYTLHTMYDDYLFYLFPQKTLPVTRPLAHAYFRGIARQATEIIGPSVKVAHFLRGTLKVYRKVNIVPNTVDLTCFEGENVAVEDVKAIKKRLGIKQGDVPLIFVGRLGKEKSIDILVDYFIKCFGGEAKYKLLLIGDGPEKDSILSQVRAHKAEKQIFVLGRIEHDVLPPYYHACELFATASTSEMNSISLLEANASGLYAVQHFDPKNRNQIEEGINGEEFHTMKEFDEIVRRHTALPTAEKKRRRAKVNEYAHRYGTPEFTAKVLNVYRKAAKKYAALERRRAE